MLLSVEEAARPIRDLDDVRGVLASSYASATELLECADVAKRFQDGHLRRQAAERFLDQLSQSRKPQDLEVVRAAEHVIYSKFGEARDLETLKRYLHEASLWLRKLLQEGQDSQRIEDLQNTVSKTLVLATDASDQSRVELCSALRKLECSQVAVKVIEPVVQKDSSNTVAMTTYGAALIDINEARQACEVLTKVLRSAPKSTYALTALSRAYNEINEPRQAHEHALNAFAIEQNDFTAHRLLSSAAIVDDNNAFEEALAAVKASLDQQAKSFTQNVLLRSAEELVDNGNAEAACRAIVELKTFRWRGEQAKRMRKLRQWFDDYHSPPLN